MFLSATDPGQQPADAGHLYLGNTAYANLPTVSGNEINFSTASTTSWAAFATRTSVAEFTVMAAVKKTVDQAQRVFTAIRRGATSNSSDDLGCYEDYRGLGWRSTGYQFGGSFTQVAALQRASSNNWQLLNRDYFILTGRYTDGVASIWINDSEMFCETVARSAVNLQDFLIGDPRSTLSNIHYWNRGCTDAEIESGVAAMQAEVTASGLTLGTNNLHIAWLGDSQFAGGAIATANAVPYVYAPNAIEPFAGAIYATSGARLAAGSFNMTTQAALAARMVPASIGTRKFVACMFIGANDGTTSIAYTAAEYLTLYAALCDSLRALGIKVVVCTLTNRKDVNVAAGFDTFRSDVNTGIRTWVGVHADAIADFAADANLGTTDAPDNATYFTDRLHFSITGQAVAEGLVRTAINGL